MITINVSLHDEVTPFITEWLRKQPSFGPRLSRALAWKTQKRIKELSNDNRITSKYHERRPYKTVRKPLANGKKPPGDRLWWGKLRRAVGYEQKGNVVELGWTSKTAAYEGELQEEGTPRRITPALRKYYGKIRQQELERGVPPDIALKVPGEKAMLETHARPLFEPAMDIVRPEYGAFMTQKIQEYIAGVRHIGVRKSNRKYKVFK